VLESLWILLKHGLQGSGRVDRDIVSTLRLVDDSDFGLLVGAVDLNHAGLHVALKDWLVEFLTAVETSKVLLLRLVLIRGSWVEVVCVLIIVVKLAYSCVLEPKNMLILAIQGLRDLAHLSI